MKIKLQCCKCHSAEKGEQLYEIDNEIYCAVCGMDALIGNGVKFAGHAEIDETESEEN